MNHIAPLMEPVDYFPPPRPQDTPERPIGSDMLDQVAVALEIPPEALAQSDVLLGDRARLLAENAEALEIFAGITDPKARERGLAYLRWIADQTALR